MTVAAARALVEAGAVRLALEDRHVVAGSAACGQTGPFCPGRASSHSRASGFVGENWVLVISGPGGYRICLLDEWGLLRLSD
jgi:hypothetical protein